MGRFFAFFRFGRTALFSSIFLFLLFASVRIRAAQQGFSAASLSLDLSDNAIRTVAGNGIAGFSGDGGGANYAYLNQPGATAVDLDGNLIIADSSNNRIRKVSPAGTISTIAGTGIAGFTGDNSPAISARLNQPKGVEVDLAGNVFVADSGNNRIRKISPLGVITTIAGNGSPGFGGDGGPATVALLNEPRGLALDSSGTLFVADSSNYRVRSISAAGVISTVAGTGVAGFKGDGGPANAARLGYAMDVAIDGAGDLYIADWGNQRIRKVNSAGVINTVAGNGASGFGAEGVAATATPLDPFGIVIDAVGNMFISEADHYRVRWIDTTGTIRTVAGTGNGGLTLENSNALSFALEWPLGLALGRDGSLFICEYEGHRVLNVAPRKGKPAIVSITPGMANQESKISATISGYNLDAVTGVALSGDGVTATIGSGGTSSVLPISINVDSTAVTGTRNVVLLTPDGASDPFAGFAVTRHTGQIIETRAGTGISGFDGDGAAALSRKLNLPRGIAVDSTGVIYFADSANHRVRKITPLGIITTIAGTGAAGYNGDNIPGTTAQLNNPLSVALDRYNHLLIADSLNHRIRTVDLSTGVINTALGTGVAGYSGDGDGLTIKLNTPSFVWTNPDDSILVADTGNNRVRKFPTLNSGIVIAGNGTAGFTGDGPATATALNGPLAVVQDSTGNIFIADTLNQRVRKVTTGVISTVAGSGVAGFDGDGTLAVGAQINNPSGLAVLNGDLLISDSGNNRIRKVNNAGIITTFSGGASGYSGDGGPAAAAQLNGPSGLAVDVFGGISIADSNNHVLRVVSPSSIPSANKITAISRTFGSPGTTIQAVVFGNNLGGVTAVNFSGSGVTATLAGAATASMIPISITIAPGASAGLRSLTATSPAGTTQAFSGFTVGAASSGNIIQTVAGLGGVYMTAGDGGPALAAQINNPSGIVIDADGNLFISEESGSRVRKVDRFGVITTVAGNGVSGFSGDGGPATAAQLYAPRGLAVDSSGNLYIADRNNNRVRMVNAAGTITTIAGNGNYPIIGSPIGDGGLATNAAISPAGLAIDQNNNLLIAENARIRKVISDGTISTIAGDGLFGFSGDGGPATSAELNTAQSIALDSSGNLFIADSGNGRVRKIESGVITTVAGNGSAGFSGDGGPATSAALFYPSAITFNSAGDLLIMDFNNARIRKVDPGGTISTIAGTGTAGVSPDGVAAASAQVGGGPWLTTDLSGNVYFNNGPIQEIVKLPPTVPVITGISPTSGVQGTTVAATITGSNLRAINGVFFSGIGITAKVSGPRTDTSIPISITIAPSANVDTRTITVPTSNTSSAAFNGFSVEQTTLPNVLSITPSSAVQGTTVFGNVTGTHLDGATSVTVNGGGVNVSILDGATSTNIPIALTVSAGTPVGLRTVTVTTASNESAPFSGLTIDPAVPIITSITPVSGNQGSTVQATIQGSSLTGVATVFFSDVGVSASISGQGTDTSLPVTIAIQSNALPGSRSAAVLTPYKTSALFNGFNVTANTAPNISGVTPSSGLRGATVNAVISGSNLSGATAVQFSGTGVSASISPGGTNTTVPLMISVAAGAALGTRTLTVTTPNGTSSAFGFFYVRDGNPIRITSILPSAVVSGGAPITATIFGRNLLNASSVDFSGSGVTATILPGGTSTSLPIQITISAGAANGPRTLTVTTPNGVSDPFNGFRVVPPPIPSLTTTIAGTGTQGFSGDGGTATSAQLRLPLDVAVDSAGNTYIADHDNFRVRKVTPAGVISTVAGTGTQTFNGDGISATTANLLGPAAVEVDGFGNLYIADSNRIRKVNSAGIITTVAGNGAFGYSGDDGPAINAQITTPQSLAVDTAGNIFLADGNRIRKVNLGGVITTVVGNGIPGFSGDGGPAVAAQLDNPTGIAVDSVGNLYIADHDNGRIRKVNTDGVISTIAGTGAEDFSGDGDLAVNAEFYNPLDVAVDGIGNVFITDNNNNRIRVILPDATILTVAGNGNFGYSGDGTSTSIAMSPFRLAVDGSGNLRIAEAAIHRVRRLDFTSAAGIPVISGISTFFASQGSVVGATLTGKNLTDANAVSFAGSGVSATIGAGGTSTSVPLTVNIAANAAVGPHAITITTPGGTSKPFFSFNVTSAIQPPLLGSILPASAIAGTTVSGTISGTFLNSANAVMFSGTGVTAVINAGGTNTSIPITITIAANATAGIRTVTVTRADGTFGTLTGLNVIAIGPAGLITTVAGNGINGFSGDGGSAVSAALSYPGLAVDAAGNIFIADSDNRRVRKVSPNGIITTIAGTGDYGVGGDGGPATSAQLKRPRSLAVDTSGNLYIGDVDAYTVRKVAPNGIISTIAGNGSGGYSGDGGPATSAGLVPAGLAIDKNDNLFISGIGSVRKVSNGVITTVAGTGTTGSGGDGGPATSAQLGYAARVAVDGAGNLYIVDEGYDRIRKVSANGIISTFAGTGNLGFFGDGGPATSAFLYMPEGLAVDSEGNVYISDQVNNRIRVVTPDGNIHTAAGNGIADFSGDKGIPTSASLSGPGDLAVDIYGNLFISDSANHRVRKITFVPSITSLSQLSGAAGTSFLLTIIGSRLNDVVAVTFDGTGVTGTIQPGATATSVTILVTIAPGATAGARTLTLTRSDGTSANSSLNVTAERRVRGQITSQ